MTPDDTVTPAQVYSNDPDDTSTHLSRDYTKVFATPATAPVHAPVTATVPSRTPAPAPAPAPAPEGWKRKRDRSMPRASPPAQSATLPSLPDKKKRKRDTAVDLNPKDPNNPAFDYIPLDENGKHVQFRFVPFNSAFL